MDTEVLLDGGNWLLPEFTKGYGNNTTNANKVSVRLLMNGTGKIA